MQRVNEASFFEVTTSGSCDAVNGFHNVTFGPGGKAIIGTLSKDVFERRTSTGSEASPFLYASTLTNFYC